jgi:4-amino-4-deoxy-L-arabinose transferase-like glycosyltransferase
VLYVLLLSSDLEPGPDGTWYSLQATIIGSGHGYLDPETFFEAHRDVPTASFPPLWPALLAALDVVGPSSQTAFQLLGAVVGTVTVALTGLLGRVVASPRVGLVAAGIVALSPALIAADGSLMADSLAVALLVATALLAARAADEPTAWRFAALGLVGGLGVLARSDAIVVVTLLVVVAVWTARGVDRRARVRALAAAIGVGLLVTVPWTIRSTVRLEQPVALSTNIGSLVEAANCPTTYEGSLLGAWDRRCLHETYRPGATEPERAEAGVRRGFAHVRREPERLPLVAAARALRAFGLWNPSSNAKVEADETRDEDWQIAAWAYALVTLLVAVPGLVLLVRHDRRRAALLLAMIGGTLVVVVLSWGNPRFRLPAEPALAVGAAVALTALGARRSLGPAATSPPTGVAAGG